MYVSASSLILSCMFTFSPQLSIAHSLPPSVVSADGPVVASAMDVHSDRVIFFFFSFFIVLVVYGLVVVPDTRCCPHHRWFTSSWTFLSF
jgi:hypothetical protein